MKKKLLIVVSVAKFFLSHRLTLAKAAQEAGYEVHIATPPSELIADITANGLIHHCISMDRGGLNPCRDIISIFSLYRLYKCIKPDLVHHVTIKPILYGGIAARLAGISAVVNAISGLGYLFISNNRSVKWLRSLALLLYKFSFSHANMRAIFQNEDDRTFFVNKNLLNKDDTTLIRGAGVDMQCFQPSIESNVSDPIVVLPARMLWDKGLAEFIEAARILKKQKVSARFVLVGDSDEGNPAVVPQEYLHALTREGVVEWWGERDDMPAVFQESNIICLPSYREGLPRALVEAAASARAIVTTDVPGCRDVVCAGQNGLLVPVKNAIMLANALLKLIRDPDLRKSMGERGRKIVESDFSLETVLNKTLEIYRSLLNQSDEWSSEANTF